MPQNTDLMTTELTQNSFVIDTLRSWLSDIPANQAKLNKNKTQAILNNILPKAGLAKPYTPEQRSINALLLSKQADKQTCQAAWEFYIDYNHTPADQAKPFAA